MLAVNRYDHSADLGYMLA